MFGLSKNKNISNRKKKFYNFGINNNLKYNVDSDFSKFLEKDIESIRSLKKLKKITGVINNSLIAKDLILEKNLRMLNTFLNKYNKIKDLKEIQLNDYRGNNNEFNDILSSIIGNNFENPNKKITNQVRPVPIETLGHISRNLKLQTLKDNENESKSLVLPDRFTNYNKLQNDYWFLNTIETDNDFDSESLNLSDLNQFSNLSIFENNELSDNFLNISEDGSDYMETPTSSYAISDYILSSLVSLQKNIKNKKEFSKLAKRRAWAHKGYLGGPTNKKSGYSKLGNHFTPRSELDLSSNEIEYSNENINNILNYIYMSNGIYNLENYNKKKLINGNKLNEVGLEKINILGGGKLKNEKIIQKYNLNNITLSAPSLFL
jgi:hypothetical protein